MANRETYRPLVPETTPSTEGAKKPKEIAIYAIEWPDESNPDKMETRYWWNGELYPAARASGHPEESNIINAGMSADDVAALAKNFSINYMEHHAGDLTKSGQPPYRLVFNPSQQIIQEIVNSYGRGWGPNANVRGLDEKEQEVFVREFQKANGQAKAQMRGTR
jgi:hypothetical protein